MQKKIRIISVKLLSCLEIEGFAEINVTLNKERK
jgi:hypothetical protein